MARFAGLWRLLGSSTSKDQKAATSVVEQANDLSEWAAALPDGEIPDAAHALDLLDAKRPEYGRFLALSREVADRTIGMRPFDVQLRGALRILSGDVVEMSTGEGKTLAGAIAAAGYALRGHGVHVISVNDYLARRDAEWMQPFFAAFGLEVGYVTEGSTSAERLAAYAADITYGSVNEIGFDVLREQLCVDPKDLIDPDPQVAIVDEADSVLVDEALVPLVLAGSTTGDTPGDEIMAAVRGLREDVHFEVDAERKNIFLTDAGAVEVEKRLGGIDLYSEEHVGTTLVRVNVALHASVLLRRDVHYIVRDGRVKLINASRGRVAELQRWPDGLQAAVEVKEGVEVSESGEILDTITVQGLIGRYGTVCGMTGTAIAAGEQFRRFYGLGVSEIPRNAECIREDEPDRVYETHDQKFAALAAFVADRHATGQPILVGTHDVAESEELAAALAGAGVSCRVLNAKNDAEEAAIIAEAGRRGAVTVSTQMAGRGIDIKLGGSDESGRDEVVGLGGLCVVGSGRHLTERLDDQLRGRAGRQGDPGLSVFFASLEDEVVRSGAPDEAVHGEPDEDGLLDSDRVRDLVDHAQRVTEGKLLATHETTWKYSQLMSDHRKILEPRRLKLLMTDAAAEEMREACPERWQEVVDEIGEDVAGSAAREIMLYHLDRGWSEHLAYLTDVRESIHLRALGRENPLDEFHRLAIESFRSLAETARTESVETFEKTEIGDGGSGLNLAALARPTSTWTYMVHDNPLAAGGADSFGGLTGVFR